MNIYDIVLCSGTAAPCQIGTASDALRPIDPKHKRRNELILPKKISTFRPIPIEEASRGLFLSCKSLKHVLLGRVAEPLPGTTNLLEPMTKKLVLLAVLALAFALSATGCASLNASTSKSAASMAQRQKFSQLDLTELSNREKWSLAREAYQQARRENA